jgi:hypothetical protein
MLSVSGSGMGKLPVVKEELAMSQGSIEDETENI